jgi:phosphatidylserine/phosphatidylglycerophosphate/cardiolipin synthase-like enzyme
MIRKLLQTVGLANRPAGVWFSPDGGCTGAVVAALAAAQSEVLVQAYSFTSPPIAQALIAARQRGVVVRLVLDKSQLTEKDAEGFLCAAAGIEVVYDHLHAIAHNKVIIIDGRTVLSGSFNFTEAAEHHNAENLIRLDDPATAALYQANWQKHRNHSSPAPAKAQLRIVA